MAQLWTGDSSGGTNPAFDHSNLGGATTSANSHGATVARVIIPRPGLTTSGIAKWLVEVKSFEITGVGILLSVFVVSVLLGALFGIKFNLNRSHDTLVMGGVPYTAAGFMQVKDGERTIYVPFYQEATLEKIIH